MALASAAAMVRVTHGLLRLTSPSDRRGGIDLRLRAWEVQNWFDGLPVYGRLESADYPPASYPMIWPFTGWMDVLTARWIWAALTVLLLCVFAGLLWRAAKSRPVEQRLWLALLPLCGYATHGLLVTGQVVAFALVPLLLGILILARSRSVGLDLLGAALVLVALIKPTLTVPLVWIAFIVPGRIRPAALIVGGYAALTLLAAAFQPVGIVELFRGWLAQGDWVNLGATYGNAQKLLGIAGLSDWFVPFALIAVLAIGIWVYRYRDSDIWLLIGATALAARLLTYHRSFDDLLIVLPLVALARIAWDSVDSRTRVLAGSLAAALWLGMMTPRVALADVSAALWAINACLPVLWLLTLGFLVREAHRHRIIVRADWSAVPARSAA